MHDVLDQLVHRCLDRIEREGSAALDALCREHPEQATALRSRMKTLVDAGLLGEPDSPPERLGDFRLGPRLGGGGMGVVYAAVQESLDREVALKIVRSDQLFFPDSRGRFRREVQLVARLAHPGIVPVYTVGEESGVPYFAMERLQGATLAEALARCDAPPHQGVDLARAVAEVIEERDGLRADVGGELYAGSGVMTCVRIAERIADALAHAHERGVLHRDLKPSNVMLTIDGRALLFDFGLASSKDAASLTTSGSRVGSLPYMSPEQVRGEEVDARSDVYGLGALLCEALTLQPPYVGGPEVLSASILRGERASIRGRRRELARDVETLVETALAHAPEQRYATISDMASELSRVLAGQPIEARPVSAPVRVGRWAQRYPARAALLALVVVAPIAFSIQQFAARQREVVQSNRAEANLDRALKALDVFVWGLGTGVLENVPHLDGDRLTMLEEAVTSIQSLTAQRPGDGALQERAVRLHTALGNVFMSMGRLEEAEHQFRAALEFSDSAELHQHELSPPLNGLGNLLEKRGRLVEAHAAFVKSAGLIEPEPLLEPRLTASIVLRNQSRLERRLGNLPGAIAAADAAVAAAELALAQASTEPELFEARYTLATALSQRAVPAKAAPGHALFGRTDEATRNTFLRALPMLRDAAIAQPRRSDVLHSAAGACTNAIYYMSADETESALTEGLALIARLRLDYPTRAAYARTHVVLAGNMGHLLVSQGRVEAARTWFEVACDVTKPWLEQEEDLTLLMMAGRADINLATNLVHLEQRAEACEPAARGARRVERALLHAPTEPFLRHDLAWARIQEGYGQIARGDAARARELAAAIPVEELADELIAVGAGELLAGCADLASDPLEAEQLRSEALDLLECGLKLGFSRLDYLRMTPEWESAREDSRFDALLSEASEAARRVPRDGREP